MSHSRECIRQSGYNVHCICGAERTENNVLRAELDAVRADLELLSERDCEHWSRHCDAEREVVKLRAENADLRARLKAVRALGWALEGVYRDTAGRALDRTTDLRVKNWRKP